MLSSFFHHLLAHLVSVPPPSTRTVSYPWGFLYASTLHSFFRYRLSSIISSVIVIIAALSVFIWAVIKQGNGGPLVSNPETVYGIGELKGAALGWAMTRMITSGIGGWAGGVG